MITVFRKAAMVEAVVKKSRSTRNASLMNDDARRDQLISLRQEVSAALEEFMEESLLNIRISQCKEDVKELSHITERVNDMVEAERLEVCHVFGIAA